MTNQGRSVRLLLLSDKSRGGGGHGAILQLHTGIFHAAILLVFFTLIYPPELFSADLAFLFCFFVFEGEFTTSIGLLICFR